MALEFEGSTLRFEQEAIRKPCNRGIVQEANACGNAQDMLTWTPELRG
jgi:hypothetical protein